MTRTKTKFEALTLMIACLLLIAGCAYGRLIEQGDAQFERGEYAAAAQSYEQALQEKPESGEASDKLARAREALAQTYIDEAEAALRQEDWIGAIVAASRAHRELPENPRVVSLVEDVASDVATKAEALESAGDFANALLLLASVSDSLPSMTTTYGPKADELRARWVASLTERAAASRKLGRFGEALVYYAKAAQLQPDPALGGERDALRRELLEKWAYWVVVRPKGSRARDAAEQFLVERVEATALRIAIDKAKDRKDATLNVRVDRPDSNTSTRSRTESVTYQSGTKQVPNPFYQNRLDDLEREQKELTRAENDVTKLENDVTRYRSDVAREGPSPNTSTGAEQNLSRAESSLEYARDKLIRQRDDVQRARERLADEPQTKEEPVYTTLDYLIETHTVTWATDVELALSHDDGREGFERSVPVTVSASDDTHGAYPVAGVSADTLDLPASGAMKRRLLGASAGAMGAAIEESFASWRATLLERGLAETDPSKRADLLAIYIVTSPTQVDPQAPIELKSLTGIPDAVAVLRPPSR